MPEIDILYNQSSEAAKRAGQEDPWQIDILVHKNSFQYPKELLELCASNVAESYFKNKEDPRWKEWFEKSYRKVALRDKGKLWNRTLEEIDVYYKELEVDEHIISCMISNPFQKSQTPDLLRKWQAVFPDLKWDKKAEVWNQGALTLIVDNSLNMKLGKSLAQVSHASMMSIEGFSLDANIPIQIFGAGNQVWNKIKEIEEVYVVRDAGLTEVESRSQTVLAFRPRSKPEYFEEIRLPELI